MILLDTCTLIWLSSSPEKLGVRARQLIQVHADSLFLSSISGFEVAVKAKKNKLQLPLASHEWLEQVLTFHGIEEISVDLSLFVKSAELSPLHQDPCDRVIIATAQEHDLILLTPDPLIRQYPNLKVEW